MTAPRVALVLAAAMAALGGCGRRKATSAHRGAEPVATEPAPPPPRDDAGRWSELAALPPPVAPRHVLELPVRLDIPRFDVHGPLVVGDLAVVASSQFGFAAIAWADGELRWSKPGGAHVAPPVALPGGELALLGDCATPPPTELPVLGCVRVVSSAGVDRSYGAVVGDGALATRMRGPGPQRTWALDDRHVAWQRGETTATIDLASGRATAEAPAPPPLLVRDRDVELELSLDDGVLSARDRRHRAVWRAPGRFAAILGVVAGLPYESPMLRVVRASTVRGVATVASSAYFDVLDLDAMTAAGGQAAFPSPGIQLLGSAARDGGATALAVRLDRSLRRDYVVAYTSAARIAWTYPLPEVLRTDPVGVAVTEDAVLLFHDGDTFTVLPAID